MTSERDKERERPEEPSNDATPPISVETLLAGRSEVRLELKGECYRLRLTRRGRLVLTK